MQPRRLLELAVALSLLACGEEENGGSGDDKAVAKTEQGEQGGGRGTIRLDEAHGGSIAALVTERDLADRFEDGNLGDEIAAQELLVVDANANAEVSSVEYVVLPGKVRERDPAKLRRKTRGQKGASSGMLGGKDVTRPRVIRGVKAGTYTVCALRRPVDEAPTCAVVAVNGPDTRVVELNID